MYCISFYFMLFLYWLSEQWRLKPFKQLPCIVAHLRILLRTYTHRAANIFVRASIDIMYAGDSTACATGLYIALDEENQRYSAAAIVTTPNQLIELPHLMTTPLLNFSENTTLTDFYKLLLKLL